MNRGIRIAAIIVAFVFVAVVSLAAGIFVGSAGFGVFAGSGARKGEPEEFAVFWQAWDIVNRNFVDQDALDPTEMTYGAIRGMVSALGDEGHTAFLTPEERERQQTDLSGSFSGIGAQLGIQDQLPVIVAPFDGSPADQAGVLSGDIIMEVNGEDVTTLPLNEIVTRIRGPEGTDVTLTLLRRGQENRTVEVTITRGEISVPAATWAMIPETNVGLIRLSQFSANAAPNLIQSVEEAREAGATALIVDVRNNPGGLLEQAIRVTSQFLEEGNVLLEEDAQGNRKAYEVERGGVVTDLPVVVLINGGSASSAEIFAGALQDHGRAQLVGETTFGTGTVLQPYVLADNSALLLGTRQWLTPDGRLIRNQGIDPDIVVDLPIEANLLAPSDMEQMTLEEIAASEDLQLGTAIELLVPSFVIPTPEPTSTE